MKKYSTYTIKIYSSNKSKELESSVDYDMEALKNDLIKRIGSLKVENENIKKIQEEKNDLKSLE